VETFVVRIWTPAADSTVTARSRELQGIVEHVQTAGSSAFRGDDELLRLLRAHLSARGLNGFRNRDSSTKGKPQ
jgi:hypothetical protein